MEVYQYPFEPPVGYRFEVTLRTGNSEFWDEVDEAEKPESVVQELLERMLAGYGFQNNDDCDIKYLGTIDHQGQLSFDF